MFKSGIWFLIAPVPVHGFSITFVVVLVNCKNEEDPIKNDGTKDLKTLNIYLPDAQGQLTLQFMVGFG